MNPSTPFLSFPLQPVIIPNFKFERSTARANVENFIPNRVQIIIYNLSFACLFPFPTFFCFERVERESVRRGEKKKKEEDKM